MATIFLLGAGFDADLAGEASRIGGDTLADRTPVAERHYPLVNDLIHLFGRSEPPANSSIEDLFQEALHEDRWDPVERLLRWISRLDYRLVPTLLSGSGTPPNPYLHFFEAFKSSTFITFNYDSVAEQFFCTSRPGLHGTAMAFRPRLVFLRQPPSFCRVDLRRGFCTCTGRHVFTLQKSLGRRLPANAPQGLAGFLSTLNSLTGGAVNPDVPGVQHRIIESAPDAGFALTLVPASDRGPHMAKCGEDRYYKRSGSHFIKMEHFDIEDMFGRRAKPNLEVCHRIVQFGTSGAEGCFDLKLVLSRTSVSSLTWTDEQLVTSVSCCPIRRRWEPSEYPWVESPVSLPVQT